MLCARECAESIIKCAIKLLRTRLIEPAKVRIDLEQEIVVDA